jgi:hypothetical protein
VGDIQIAGEGADQDEEVIATGDGPLLVNGLVVEFRKLDFREDTPVLFASSNVSDDFDVVIGEAELQAAYLSTGFEIGEIPLAALPSFSTVAAIDAFKFRETTGKFFLTKIRLSVSCDDGNDCTQDSCDEGVCQFTLLPEGSACGDPGESDCDLPDSCSAQGTCRANLVPDGTPCDGPVDCEGAEVCTNGVCGPDACGQFTGGCTGLEWSCADNWNLGGAFPDNKSMTSYSVILNVDDRVFLDRNITIDSLQMFENSVLLITKEGEEGNLSMITAGGLYLAANLFINNSRKIEVLLGPTTIGDGGRYAIEPTIEDLTVGGGPRPSGRGPADPPPIGGTVVDDSTRDPSSPQTDLFRAPGAGDFEAVNFTIMSGGIMELSGTMTLTVSGDFLLDGSDADPCESAGLRGGVVPPPKFTSTGSAQTTVGDDFEMTGTVDFLYASSFQFSLGGDFEHHGTAPACFDWGQGGLELVGTSPQTIEAAGRDVGPLLAGYHTGATSNFSIGSVEVAAGRNVTVVNSFANIVGSGPCEEALYVEELTLRAGATLTLNDCRVYYRTLIQEAGVTVTPLGCGGLAAVPDCLMDADCADAFVCSNDVCDTATGLCTYASIPALTLGDVDYSMVVDVADILCVLNVFSGILTCPAERADLDPCGGDGGTVDVADILAVLDAFSGTAVCPDPCPLPS